MLLLFLTVNKQSVENLDSPIGLNYVEVDKVRRIVSICLSSDSNTSDSNKQIAIRLQQIG